MKQFNSSRAAKLAFACASLLGTMLMAPVVQAQPDINNGAKAENPANRRPGKRANKVELTPLQRTDERLRRQLQALGVTDAAMQEPIITYVRGELTAREPLLGKGLQLMMGIRADALSDAQAAALLNDYQAAIEEDRARHLKALETLQKSVDFTKIPKVEALLTLMGIYGDGPTLLNGTKGFGIEKRLRGVDGKDKQLKETAPVAPAKVAEPNTA